MQTLCVPLENGPKLSPSSLHLVILNVGWFCHSTAIYSWCECGAIKHEPGFEVWRKPVAVLFRFIPIKSLLLQWLFNLPLVAQWINFWLMYGLPMLGIHFCIKINYQIFFRIKKKDFMDLTLKSWYTSHYKY